jgi:phosphoribosylcarboxyaminoimidazole (NCAIR) mutase
VDFPPVEGIASVKFGAHRRHRHSARSSANIPVRGVPAASTPLRNIAAVVNGMVTVPSGPIATL